MVGWLEASPIYRSKPEIISLNRDQHFGSVGSRDHSGESANTGSHRRAARVTMEPVEDHRWVKIHWSGEEIVKCEQIQDGGVVEEVVQSL